MTANDQAPSAERHPAVPEEAPNNRTRTQEALRGFWGTAGWGLLVFAAWAGLQGATLVAFVAIADVERPITEWATDGMYVAVATLVSALVCVALLLLLAILRGRSSPREYLAFRVPRLRSLLLWILGAAGFWAVFNGLAFLLDREASPFMAEVYATATSPALLWLALVVAAPVFEEIFFRGFLFRGWARSRLKAYGTIFLTAVLWAGLHAQYDAFEMGGIFAYGLLLGVARHRTNTVTVPIVLHMLTNAVACAMVAFSVGAQ